MLQIFLLDQSMVPSYVDGLSITYGNPKRHVWTYNYAGGSCICRDPGTNPSLMPPSFVHDNYYCESGIGSGRNLERVYIDDPLWDVENCATNELGCCSEPSLPWFCRQIPLAANYDIETRICQDKSSSNEDLLISNIQLYVQ